MKIIIISGSTPPFPCGVGNYAETLKKNLNNTKDNNAVVLGSDINWSFISLLNLLKLIVKNNVDVINIQYPTIGYGYRLTPHLLSLFFPNIVVTIHEVSQINILRRLSLIIFTIRAKKIIFTNQYELNYALKYVPWIKYRAAVVPIGTSISSGPKLFKDDHRIVYFGLIRPEKGIEDVLNLAELIKESALPYNVHIIGMVGNNCNHYYESLRKISINLPVNWHININDEEVSKILASSTIAYLPFPDGVSERRSSLFAILANNILLITSIGKFTTEEMRKSFLFANAPKDALLILKSIYINEIPIAEILNNSKSFLSKYSWHSITKKYLKLFESI